MKLPTSLGQKKTKAIEQMLEEIGVGKAVPVIYFLHIEDKHR